MNLKLVETVNNRYLEVFGEKGLMVFSPGRVNLIGEHTDYNEGFVFPAAIDKGIVLSIGKSELEKCTVHAIDANQSYQFNLNQSEPLPNGDWKNYVIGVVAEIQKKGIKLGNFNAVFSGDIPSGSGLSSSAALENSFVFGLNLLFDLGLSRKEMAIISQKAEHNFAGVKCGIMDQYASMFGLEDSALLLDCRSLDFESFTIDFIDYELMLINSNVKHQLNDSAYNDRRDVCEMISEKLSIKALRDANEGDLQTLISEISNEDYQKGLYVFEENQRVLSFAKAIKENDIRLLGELLYKSHQGLSEQYKVSCKELDFLVDFTKQYPEILGCRMMGGGFGGCTINIIKKEFSNAFETQITKAYKTKFNIDCTIIRVQLSQGVHQIKL